MDWPCTAGSVRPLADHFGVPVAFSWREGGFAGEPDRWGRADGPDPLRNARRSRRGERQQPCRYAGTLPAHRRGPARPLVQPVAEVRCPRRRAPRSGARPGRTPRPSSPSNARRKARHARTTPPSSGIAPRPPCETSTIGGPSMTGPRPRCGRRSPTPAFVPQPVHVLGWGRLSCRTRIFGSPDQRATVRLVFRGAFRRIQACEAASDRTIHRSLGVVQLADRGPPFPAATLHPDELAQARIRTGDCRPRRPWLMPAGAFGDASGPS